MNSWEMSNHVLTCKECAHGISNDDWSYIDSGSDCEDDAYQRHSSVAAQRERFGVLVHKESVDVGGYYNCQLCWDVHIGSGDVFVTRDYFPPGKYDEAPPL